jgi:uncharacterized protein YjdB
MMTVIKKTNLRMLFLLFLIAAMLFFSCDSVWAEETVNTQQASTGTITFSVEKFTLGEGYYVEPCQIPIYNGDTGITVLNRIMGETNLRWKANYLQGIYGAQAGTVNVPACISKMPSHPDFGAAPTTANAMAEGLTYSDQLSEKDYSPMSGWMYSVNNTFPGYGFDGYTPADGDVLRVQFTLWGYGADLGQDFQGGMTPINTADKTKLAALLGEINSSSNKSQYLQNATFSAAYTKAYSVMQNLEASKKLMEDMYSELLAAIPAVPVNPKTISVSPSALALKKSQTSQLSVSYQPADTTDTQTVAWSSSNNKVATVSAAGMVIGVGEGSATITATTAAGLKADCKVTVAAGELAAVNCTYRTHVENDGWQDWRSNGAMSGTSARSLRLEGIELKLADTTADLGIQYQTHIENIGWEDDWKSNGTMSGTTGRSLRLEAIRIQLTGNDADKYDVYYQVHAQNIGWMGWAKNGASSGTAGFAYRLEGIKIVVVPKGETPPNTTIDQPLSFIKNS